MAKTNPGRQADTQTQTHMIEQPFGDVDVAAFGSRHQRIGTNLQQHAAVIILITKLNNVNCPRDKVKGRNNKSMT